MQDESKTWREHDVKIFQILVGVHLWQVQTGALDTSALQSPINNRVQLEGGVEIMRGPAFETPYFRCG